MIIYSMGIGLDVERDELAAMATDPQHVFLVNSFQDLDGVVSNIRKEVCKGNCMVKIHESEYSVVTINPQIL